MKFIINTLKSNNGSLLVMVLIVIIVLTILGTGIIGATMNGLNLSMTFKESDTLYYYIESLAGKLTYNIDKKVIEFQKEAEMEASSHISELLKKDNSPLIDESGQLDNKKLNEEYNNYYLYRLSSEIDLFFSNIGNNPDDLGSLINEEHNFYPDDSQNPAIFFENNNIAVYIPIDLINVNTSNTSKDNLEYPNKPYSIYTEYKLSLSIKGKYISLYKNNITKSLRITLDLMSNALSSQFNPVPKYNIKYTQDEIPEIIKNKAVVAEKNIICASNVEITGDAICFGTIPISDLSEEDLDATGDKYGGFVVGINSSSIGEQFKFDTSIFSDIPYNGSLKINGNAITMSYVHTLFSNGGNQSSIAINGDIYSRSLKSEKSARNSTINIDGNTYITDNFQIDSDFTEANIQNNFYGFVSAGYDITDDNSNSDEEFIPKKTSSVVINGDNSKITFNGEVYIGGTTFFKNYLLNNDPAKPYSSGIAGLKPSSKLIEAYFAKNNKSQINPVYYYDENNNTYSSTTNIDYANYSGKDLITGYTLDSPKTLKWIDKALHIKGLWDLLWSNEPQYKKALILDRIELKSSSNGKYSGYINGGIFANTNVLTYREFSKDFVDFQDKQTECIKKFRNNINIFINNSDLNSRKLDYVLPEKKIDDHIDKEVNFPQSPIYKLNSEDNSFILYSKDNEILIHDSNADGKWELSTRPNIESSWEQVGELPSNNNTINGIIISLKNIYIDTNNSSLEFSLNGSIISKENIIFSGSNKININYDENIVKFLLNDPAIGFLFKLNTDSQPQIDKEQNMIVQRINTSISEIKILEWKEE